MSVMLSAKTCASPLLASPRTMAYHQPAPFSSCSGSRSRVVRLQLARATSEDKDANPFLAPGPSTPSPSSSGSDRRVESLEKAIRGGGGKRSSNAAPKQQRKIPIRGVDQPAQEKVSEEFAPWKEGQLFPEGWERMTLAQKASELYMGQRGFLFWASKSAYASAIGMLVAWVFFRFVGPNLGLYQLAGDLVVPQI